MKHQLWIINFFAGNRDSGWGERHFFLAKELQKENVEVLIISSAKNHMFDKSVITDEHFCFRSYEDVKFCWIKVPGYNPKSILRFWSMWVFTLKLFFIPKSKISRPDSIVVSSMPMFPILSALYFKWRFRSRKLAFEVRDLWPLTPIYLGSVSPRNPMILLMKIIERMAYRKSSFIISLLPKANEYIDGISGCPAKFFYLPNGADTTIYTDEELPLDITQQLPKNKFIVGYAGTIGVANAMEYVIEAARLLQNEKSIHFVVLGSGYLQANLITQASGLTNVTFLPKVKKGQVSKIIAHYDLCIISWHRSPLYKFGVSANKLFDYMLASKPILFAGDIQENPVMLSGCGICVEPEHPQLMAEAILKFFYMDGDTRYVYGKRGYSYLLENHSYERLAKKLLTKLNE